MNKLDQLLDLHEELDSPHEPIRKQVKIKYDALYTEIQGLIEIGDSDLGIMTCDLINENTKLESQVGLLQRSFDESSKCLIERGVIINKLKEEQGMMFNHRGVIAKLREKLDISNKLSQDRLEVMNEYKSDSSECAKNCAKFAVENDKLKEELDLLQQSHDNYTQEIWNQHMDIQYLKEKLSELCVHVIHPIIEMESEIVKLKEKLEQRVELSDIRYAQGDENGVIQSHPLELQKQGAGWLVRTRMEYPKDEAQRIKGQIINDNKQIEQLKEDIENGTSHLERLVDKYDKVLEELGNARVTLDKINDLTYHVGCQQSPKCVWCMIQRLAKGNTDTKSDLSKCIGMKK